MRYFIGIARGAGYTLNLNTALVILIASRLIFTWLRDTPLSNILPLDKAFPKIHIIVGYTIAVTVVIHMGFHLTWIIWFDQWEGGLWNINQSVATGIAITLIFAVMLFFARPSVRKNRFQVFYIVHLVGAFLFFGLLIFHGMYRFDPETYKWITPALVVYAIDRLLRHLRVSKAKVQLNAEHSIFKDDNVLEICIPKPFKYRGGQYAEIKVPSINREWHPFTIASARHEDTMRFYIKDLGDWTHALHEAFQARLNGTVTESLDVCVRGPFGAPCQHVSTYEKVVLISGGIGSTPFSAVCKELQHLQVKHKATANSDMHCERLAAVDKRINKAIAELYDVNIENLDNVTATEEQRSVYVTNMLRLTQYTKRQLSPFASGETASGELSGNSTDLTKGGTSSDMEPAESTATQYLLSETESSGDYQDSDEIKPAKKKSHPHFPGRPHESLVIGAYKSLVTERHARQKLAYLFRRRSQLLSFLHTTRVTFALLVSLIIRIVIISMGSIFHSDYVRFHEQVNAVPEGRWVIIADAPFALILAIILPLTIILEISFMKGRFFSSADRCIDFFVFLPLLIFSTILEIQVLIVNEPEDRVLLVIYYAMLIPILFILLSFRMYRSIGTRSLLMNLQERCQCACTCPCRVLVPDVDFVWTTPHGIDDKWLRAELEPLAGGTKLRLHRYVTRDKVEDVEGDGEDFITTTHEGRPKWDQFFQEVAATAPSNCQIGVFFCGPHVMGTDIINSLRKVEIVSNLRGAYLRGTSKQTLKSDLGLVTRDVVEKLRTRGCSVRFVFREENFG